ncbi:MAG: YeeE/YedE family protein [Myxococcales bacterium]|nr:YeeE/YedE family protein [Myxococcales bacterium]MCB9532272.1 YeeE/YedE family protein [Myxococcales bacterium]
MTLDTIAAPLAGGVLIGTASAALLALNGRIAGISGIFANALFNPLDRHWRVAFVAGLVAGGLALRMAAPQVFGPSSASLGVLAIAGLLVGFGTQLGSGCTSGHGVCGIGRLSPRGLAATLTFITTGAIAVTAVRMLGGGV